MSVVDDIKIKRLKQKYALSDDHFQAILGIIIKKYARRVLPSTRPVAVLLDAQIWTGKTVLQKEAEYQLLKNVIVCNAYLEEGLLFLLFL